MAHHNPLSIHLWSLLTQPPVLPLPQVPPPQGTSAPPDSSQKTAAFSTIFPHFLHFPLHFLWQIKRFLTLLCCIVLKIRMFRLVFPFSALKPLIRYFQEPHTVPSMSPFCILHISVLQQTWKTCMSGSPYSLNHHRGSNNGHTYNRIIAASP